MDTDRAERLQRAFLGMKRQEAMDAAALAIQSGDDPLVILKTCREAMEAVGKRFETGEFFLSELIYSAEVFRAVSAMLEPVLRSGPNAGESRGSVVIGTPRGDIHDLGKNIVATMLRAHGFTVHDVGVDAPPETLVEAVETTGAPILALSALITPAFASMKAVISLLEAKQLRDKTFVIIGGGVTSELARREIGADAQTLNPAEAIRLCSRYIANRHQL